jgi:hypothetical protein
MLNRALCFGSWLCFHLQIKESAESGKNLRKKYPQTSSSKGSPKLGAFFYLKKEAAPASKMWYSIKIRHCTAKVPKKADYFNNH